MSAALPRIRRDLVYTRDSSNANYFFVKDPIRAQFFRFNALQVEMMRALDGSREIEELAEFLGEQFETEIPPSSIEQLISRLHRDLLLDVTSYAIESEKGRERIRAALKAKGLFWRGMVKDSDTAFGRKRTRETELFQQGIRKIESGDPCEAAASLAEILTINPKNERARAMFDVIHESFFMPHRAGGAFIKTWHAWDPDEFLFRLDRYTGWFFFSPLSLILLGILILATIGPAL